METKDKAGLPSWADPNIDYDSLFYHDVKPVKDEDMFASYKATGVCPADLVDPKRQAAYTAYLEAHINDK